MKFPLIDVLRAVAALLVLTFHVVGLGKWNFFAGSAWGFPFEQGWMGVDLFLVISGFVITLSAARELQKGAGDFRWQFMQRRLRRILPLYALSSVVYVLLVRPDILLRPADQVILPVLSQILFVQNLFPSTHGVLLGAAAINPVTWSLALEMQFYLLLIFSIGHLVRWGAWRSGATLIAISWAWRFGTTFVLVPGEAVPPMQVIVTTELPGTLDAFGMGIFLALLVFKGGRFAARWLKPTWANCLAWLALAVALLWLASNWIMHGGNYWAQAAMIVFWRSALALGFAAALAAAIACPMRGNGLWRPLRYLGQISYGVYLWHFAVVLAMVAVPGLREEKLFLAVLLGSVVLASLSWHLLEQHWIKKID